jgi:type II secretory pathway pseudopilin PulG
MQVLFLTKSFVEAYKYKIMKDRHAHISSRRAVTLLELVLAMVMITIVFAAVLPQFAIMGRSWDSKQGSAEVLQNGRVFIDHISRNLSEAKIITAVSESSVTNGYIQFKDYNDVTYRYDIASADNYVECGPVGTLTDLAGPVSSLKFTCYDACNIDTPLSPVTDVNVIRLVKIDVTFTNSASMGQAKTFTTLVYLRGCVAILF